MRNYLRNIFTASALLVMFSATFAFPASVTFSSPSAGNYIILGSNMDGVAGIQLNVTYDAASLATPTVTQGGLVAGAMLAANTTQPGIIKIAIISTRAFSGSGQIATISFASKKGSGGITSITTDMIDSKGSAIASSGSSNLSSGTAAAEIITTPGIPFSQPSTTTTSSTASTAATTTATTTTQTIQGTITLPTDMQQRTEPQPAPSSAVPSFSRESTESIIAEEQTKPSDKSTPELKTGKTSQIVAYKGILERFKLYSGNKKFSTMVTFFDIKTAQNIHQEPAILLSNGQSNATVTVDVPSKTNSSLNFAVNGGKLISFKQDAKNTGRWIIVVLPDIAAYRTTITIIAGDEYFESPLTVTPPIKTKLTLDEQGWNRFLKEVGTVKAPLHDFNNDGVRNYVDEFIFIANCLAKKTAPTKPVPTPKKSVK
ncbi:MAG: hypothetical protein HGB32_02640 [Geobacteraceae bacterium]|nr:hypothetical protein [Geobacteraceae bacterium]NTW79031.1 hypothetical protein [Geobacteraceae bacterium]